MRSTLFILIASFLCLGIASCERESMIPLIEDCVILSDKCYCYDERLPEGERKYYPGHNCVGYRATNADDYSKIEKTVLDMELRIIKCERGK